MSKDVCEGHHPSASQVALNFVLLVAVIASALAQCRLIVARRSTQGLSPSAVVASTLFSICIFAMSLMSLGTDQASCFRLAIQVSQAGAHFLGSSLILKLFLRYHPRKPETPSIPLLQPGIHEQNEEDIIRPKHSFVLPVHGTLRIVVVVFAILVFAVTIPFSLPGSHSDLAGAIVGGCILLVLTMLSIMLLPLQYIPQIRMTYRRKRAESLSLTTLCIQTAMWVIIPAHWLYKFQIHSRRTLVFIGLTICLLPGILLGLVIHYEYILPQREAKTIPTGFAVLNDDEVPPPSYGDVEADKALVGRFRASP